MANGNGVSSLFYLHFQLDMRCTTKCQFPWCVSCHVALLFFAEPQLYHVPRFPRSSQSSFSEKRGQDLGRSVQHVQRLNGQHEPMKIGGTMRYHFYGLFFRGISRQIWPYKSYSTSISWILEFPLICLFLSMLRMILLNIPLVLPFLVDFNTSHWPSYYSKVSQINPSNHTSRGFSKSIPTRSMPGMTQLGMIDTCICGKAW